MGIPILSIQTFAARILQAATSISDILPIVASVKALVHSAIKSPAVPKKADGFDYTAEELSDLIIAMQSEAHEAWHTGDLPPAAPPTE